MKVVSSGSLQITGPLSRNDRILHMSAGDRISVLILERTGKDSAVIDLLGNRVNARFTSGVPREDRLILVMTEIRNGILEFSLRSGEPDKAGMNFIAQTLLREKDIAPEKTRALLSMMKSRIPGVFSFAILYSSEVPVRRADEVRRILSLLRNNGFPKEKLFMAGAILSGFSDDATIQLAKFLSSDGLFFAEKEAEKMSESVYIADAESATSNGADFLVQWEDEEGRSEVECVRTSDFYAGRIETPRLGLIEFVVRKDRDLSVTVVCEEKTRVILVDRLPELVSAIEKRYDHSSVVCLSRSEWNEKVLAFAENTGKRALDVSV